MPLSSLWRVWKNISFGAEITLIFRLKNIEVGLSIDESRGKQDMRIKISEIMAFALCNNPRTSPSITFQNCR